MLLKETWTQELAAPGRYPLGCIVCVCECLYMRERYQKMTNSPYLLKEDEACKEGQKEERQTGQLDRSTV
jgi:hypothetical protein